MVATREFSRDVAIEPWPEGRVAVALEASAAERSALARRFDLVDLPALSAEGSLERSADGREIWFHGRLEAEVVQTCVVSLEPVYATIEEPVERRFRLVDDVESLEPEVEVLLDPEEVEAEPLLGPAIDLGELIAEELSLALDPYPKTENAYALLPDLGPDVSVGPEPEMTAEARRPFAALQKLRTKSTR